MKKLFAVLLAVVMMATMSVSALADEDTTTIYLDIGDTDFGTVYCYAYERASSGPNCNAAWPGIEMTQVVGSIYSTELSSSLDTIIFNNGSHGIQTDLITRPTDGKNLYTYATEAWSTYLESSPATGKGAGDYTIGINGTYVPANVADVISVDISWGAMNFTYTAPSLGTWNPDSHTYTGGTEGGWSTDKPSITVTNHSNAAVEASFRFAAADGVTTTGTFYTKGEGDTYTAITSTAAQELSLATAVGTERANAPAGTIYFGVSGDAVSADQTLGNITVTIAKDTKIYTGEALAAALTSLGATGGTITLGADVTLPVDVGTGLHFCQFTVGDNKTLVLDLNGHTMTGILYADSRNGNGSALFTVKNGTLQYTTSTGAGEAGIITASRTNTQLNDVTITASGILAVVNVYSTMKITDCTLNDGIADDIVSVANAGGTITFAGKIVIDGAVMPTSADAIFKFEAGTYNFDPTDLVDADNYTVTDNGNGTWTVAANS